ncbi:MAG: hypothetical protein K6B52_07370 [Clostridiales bacterium]|nr:hypothetical protein [Clostridiales bacterium]
MKLFEFDDKSVRITLKDGSVFEGVCMHDPEEYCEIELGINEECLEISGWLFRESDISSVELVTESNPYISPFDKIEKTAVEEGIDSILDILLSDEPLNAGRMLACLEWYIKEKPELLPEKKDLEKALKQTVKYYSSESIAETCLSLLTLLG